MRTHIADALCPACGNRGLQFNAEQIELPYLGRSLETLLRCEACGYRSADFILTEQKEPTRVSYRVTEEADMSVRVVRSSSGTIRIPELGIDIEPGVASEAFVSNIEGIIVRIERVLDQLHRDAPDAGQRERVEALQGVFAAMRDGTADPVTVVIEDPLGNSAILAPKAVKEPLPAEEADKLRVGMSIIDPDNVLQRALEEE